MQKTGMVVKGVVMTHSDYGDRDGGGGDGDERRENEDEEEQEGAACR